MSDAGRVPNDSLATRSGRDGAVAAAIERLVGTRFPALLSSSPEDFERRLVGERPDTPDLQITAARRVPAAAAEYVPFPAGLDPRLSEALIARGVGQLYSHQAESIAHTLGGKNVVVITPTASGKTLCYNIPVIDAVLADRAARALYLFPTKAL